MWIQGWFHTHSSTDKYLTEKKKQKHEARANPSHATLLLH